MAVRPFTFAVNEHYHCFNRGVDKRVIFVDQQDYIYFLQLLKHLNTSDVLGSLRLHKNKGPVDPPVTMLSYCLLPNHYHLILRSNIDGGVSKYLQRIAGGYTMYFNQKYERTGSLFQGKFKAKHIESDQDLRQMLAYVRYNYIVHEINDTALYRSGLNTKDDLVRGLASNFQEEAQKEVVGIIKEMRSSRQGLEL
jgi:REP element-mobilizing transposase RayT